MNEPTWDTLIVSIDFSHGEDVGVLLVGRRVNKDHTEIVNAFQGAEARDLYTKLITKKPATKEVR